VHFEIQRMVIVVDETDKKARRDRGNASHGKSPGIFASLPPVVGLQDTHEQPIMGARILFLHAAGGKHYCKFISGSADGTAP
jgi:hypothetical protein